MQRGFDVVAVEEIGLTSERVDTVGGLDRPWEVGAAGGDQVRLRLSQYMLSEG